MSRSLAPTLLALSGALVLSGARAPRPRPRSRPRKDHAQVWHGRTFVDPYYWLREKGSPEVVKYLEAENAYTEAMTARPEAVQRGALRGDARPHQADRPRRPDARRRASTTTAARSRACSTRSAAASRRARTAAFREDAAEEVLLDQNEMAKGLPFLVDRRVRGERRRRAAPLLDRRRPASASTSSS